MAAFNLDLPNCLKVTPNNFIVDCSRDRDTPFNKHVISVFADDYLDKINNHAWYCSAKIPQRYRDFDVVTEAFKSHFAYIKQRYRQVVVAPLKDPVAAEKSQSARLQRSSHGSRKVRVSTL